VYSTIMVEKREGRAKIILNRPEVLNALSPQMLRELGDALEEIAGDDSIGVVVITGAGRAFSAGVDIKGIDETKVESSAAARTKLALRVIDHIEAMDKPVIAAVNGYCLTGGLELAIACDIIVASEEARFGDTHAKWGLTPIWGGSQRLPRIVGAMKAKEMVFTCELLTAEEAREVGLAGRVTSPEALQETVDRMAGKILENSRDSIKAQKHLINKGMKMDFGSGLKMAEKEAPGATPDSEARLRSFKDKA